MKLIESTTFSETIKGVQLFRDDIEEIMNRCVEKSIELKLSDSKYSYESLDEIPKYRGNFLSQLDIDGKSTKMQYTYIGISFEKAKARLFLRGSTELYSLGYELKDFLQKRIPWHYKVFNPPIWFCLSWFAGSEFFFLNYQKEKTTTLSYQWLGWVSIALLILCLTSLLNRHFNFKINLSRKHETGFLKRNGEKILLIAISSIIGSFITLLIQWISKTTH